MERGQQGTLQDSKALIQVDAFKKQKYWPFRPVARIACRMCLVWTAEQWDNCSSKQPP